MTYTSDFRVGLGRGCLVFTVKDFTPYDVYRTFRDSVSWLWFYGLWLSSVYMAAAFAMLDM